MRSRVWSGLLSTAGAAFSPFRFRGARRAGRAASEAVSFISRRPRATSLRTEEELAAGARLDLHVSPDAIAADLEFAKDIAEPGYGRMVGYIGQDIGGPRPAEGRTD